jgi:hypothetical protein
MEVLGWIPAFAGMTKKQLDSYRSAGLKKKLFPNMTTRLVKFTSKPARPQARLQRLPGSIDSCTCLLMISMSTITTATLLVPNVKNNSFGDGPRRTGAGGLRGGLALLKIRAGA